MSQHLEVSQHFPFPASKFDVYQERRSVFNSFSPRAGGRARASFSVRIFTTPGTVCGTGFSPVDSFGTFENSGNSVGSVLGPVFYSNAQVPVSVLMTAFVTVSLPIN